MTRAQLRLDILRIIYHPGKPIEQNVEFLLAYEKQAFGDLSFDEEPAAPAAPVSKRKA
jgi:hypothetical protein